MNKQSILIIAGLMGAIGVTSVASAMEFQLYGSVRAGVHIPTTDDVMKSDALKSGDVIRPETQTLTPDAAKEGTSAWEWGVGNAGDRIGIKGSEDLGNGISAGFVFERGTDDDNELNRRHQNAWINKAGWGKFTFGQQGNPYRNVANWDQAYWLGGRGHVGDGGTRLNGIRYDRGFGPFSISVMGTASPDIGVEQIARTTKVNYADPANNAANNIAANHILLTHPEVESVDGLDSVIVAAHYKIGNAATINLGPVTINLGLDTINLGVRYNSVESNRLGTEVGGQYSNAALSANGSAGVLDWYIGYAMSSDNYKDHTMEGAGTAPDDTAAAEAYISKRFVAQDAATLGLYLSWSLDESNLVYLEYESVSQDGTDEALGDLGLTAALLGYSRSISPNSTFFVEYASRDRESELSADTSAILAVIKVDF